jgi:hypothetical protein
MRVLLLALILSALTPSARAAPPAGRAEPAWIARSNHYTNELLALQLAHSPESASHEGLTQYDERISDPRLADDLALRHELEAALVKLNDDAAHEADKHVLQDLAILRKAFDLGFRRQKFDLAHKVPYANASEQVFEGLRALLDDQVAPTRRPAALVRLRRYAGLDPGYQPYTGLLRQRALDQMARPGVIYPSKREVETDLARNANYVKGIADLLRKYSIQGWEGPYEKLRTELADYDAWVRADILPKARTDFRLQPEEYALALEGYGIDIPPTQLAARARAAFKAYQAEMAPLAAQIAKSRGLPSSDYRDVIRELKKLQLTDREILPFYKHRLHDIEQIIREHHLVTLPAHPAIIRLATPAESVGVPAPHMNPPPFLHNTGQRGEFVLPLGPPSSAGAPADGFNDFTYDAAAWPLTAHEARPGHELQFDSMVEHGVSLARALYAFNSTNAEGWGMYAEHLVQPYEPAEGQLLTLQSRLVRAARAFLDPGLQSGEITPAQTGEILQKDVVLSPALTREEVERFTFRAPGQAGSYFYGYSRMLELRSDTEQAMGARFDPQQFHDFVLRQGLLTPDLLRKAVFEDFIPAGRPADPHPRRQ